MDRTCRFCSGRERLNVDRAGPSAGEPARSHSTAYAIPERPRFACIQLVQRHEQPFGTFHRLSDHGLGGSAARNERRSASGTSTRSSTTALKLQVSLTQAPPGRTANPDKFKPSFARCRARSRHLRAQWSNHPGRDTHRSGGPNRIGSRMTRTMRMPANLVVLAVGISTRGRNSLGVRDRVTLRRRQVAAELWRPAPNCYLTGPSLPVIQPSFSSMIRLPNFAFSSECVT